MHCLRYGPGALLRADRSAAHGARQCNGQHCRAHYPVLSPFPAPDALAGTYNGLLLLLPPALPIRTSRCISSLVLESVWLWAICSRPELFVLCRCARAAHAMHTDAPVQGICETQPSLSLWQEGQRLVLFVIGCTPHAGDVQIGGWAVCLMACMLLLAAWLGHQPLPATLVAMARKHPAHFHLPIFVRMRVPAPLHSSIGTYALAQACMFIFLYTTVTHSSCLSRIA